MRTDKSPYATNNGEWNTDESWTPPSHQCKQCDGDVFQMKRVRLFDADRVLTQIRCMCCGHVEAMLG